MIIRVLRRISLPLCLSFLLSSCITIDNSLGQDFIPEDQILSIASATFNLPVSNKASDSLFTASTGYYIYGSCYDPVFGYTHAGSVIQFYPTLVERDYGEQPEPVSLIMTVINSGCTILDASQANIPQNIYVHRMLTDVSVKRAYNNSLQTQDWDATPLSYGGPVFFGSDTLTVNLSLDYARELLNATAEDLKTDSAFVKKFKGIYLRTQEANKIPNSGRLNISTLNDLWLTLTYRTKGADVDSVVLYGSQSAANYNAITHDQDLDNTTDNQNVYFQGFAGVKPYIDFVSLKENMVSWAQAQNIDPKRLLISRAEIILPYKPELSFDFLAQVPTSLFLCTRQGADTTLRYYPVSDVAAEYAGGAINRSQYHYSFVVTRYVQHLLKTDTFTISPNTWIMDVQAEIDPITGKIVSYPVNNTSYSRMIFKGVASDSPPILKLSYAVLK